MDIIGLVKLVWNKGYLKTAMAGTILLILAAGCTPADTNAIDSDGVPTEPIVTEIAALPTATFTPEFTPTPTNTATPSEVPTPTEIRRVKLSMDIENPVFVPWDKVVAGLMESAITEPFNENAVVKFPWSLMLRKDWNVYEFATPAKYPDPELRPFRLSGYGWTKTPDGQELIIIREDVHNADGTIGHWNFIYEAERFGLGYGYRIKEELASGDKYLKPVVGEGGSVDEDKYWVSAWLRDLSNQFCPKAMEYLQEYVDTNIVNPDGENYLWVPIRDTWD